MSNCDHEYFHLVFSTKYRYPWLTRSIQEQCWTYIGGIITQAKAHPLQIGGMEDHIHILLKIPITVSRIQLIRTLKSTSTQWIRRNFPECAGFKWQISYGNFSVSPQNLESVQRYILNQETRHKSVSYKDEYKAMLKECKADYDDKTIWD